MMFVGPGWLNKMGRWEAPYELLKNPMRTVWHTTDSSKKKENSMT